MEMEKEQFKPKLPQTESLIISVKNKFQPLNDVEEDPMTWKPLKITAKN